jgi:hypothetical protein
MIAPACSTEAPAPQYVSTLIENRIPSSVVSSIYSSGGFDMLLVDAKNRAQQLQSVLFNEVVTDDPRKDLSSRIVEIRNDEDEDAPPTEYAIAQALSLTEDSANLLAQRWRAPRVATDGYGGLRLSWRDGRRELRAVITGSKERERYLYWEEIGGYGSVANFTAITLFSYLDRLLSNKAFPGA